MALLIGSGSVEESSCRNHLQWDKLPQLPYLPSAASVLTSMSFLRSLLSHTERETSMRFLDVRRLRPVPKKRKSPAVPTDSELKNMALVRFFLPLVGVPPKDTWHRLSRRVSDPHRWCRRTTGDPRTSIRLPLSSRKVPATNSILCTCKDLQPPKA